MLVYYIKYIKPFGIELMNNLTLQEEIQACKRKTRLEIVAKAKQVHY